MKNITTIKLAVYLLVTAVIVSLSAGSDAQAQAQPAAAAAGSSNSISTASTISTALDLNITLPPWAQTRSSDFQLNFSAADALILQQQQAQHATFRGLPLNVTHQQGYYYGNVAVARFGSQVVLAVRKIQFYLSLRSQLPDYPQDPDPTKKWVSWWVSAVSVCSADPASLQPLRCSDYDPRSWRGEECMWNAGFESLGPEDPRLIVWPGKGLFIMITSKPWPLRTGSTKPSETRCAGPWAQQPWLAPVITYPRGANSSSSISSTDPWVSSGLIRLQFLPEHVEQAAAQQSSSSSSSSKQHNRTRHRVHHALHKEKNWNPFVYNSELYFSQSFNPHVVIKPSPNGSCTKAHQTDSPVLQQLLAKPRGNTQAVLLPAAVTGEAEDVYVGVLHVEVQRSYTNYFYKMQAQPPFAITALSAPIPLVYGPHPRIPAWRHIAFPMSLQLIEESRQLMMGYGSGDQVPRVRVLGLEEVLQLFEQGQQQQQQGRGLGAGNAAAGVLD